jgi:hypothetical protein
MKKQLGFTVIGVLVLLLGALGSWETYYVSDRPQVGLLWNHREVYLSASVFRRGYRITYLGYLLGYAMEYFNDVPASNDKSSYAVMVRITSTSVQRYVADKMSIDLCVPLDDTVYASDGGLFWRWAGDHFEKASQEEQENLQGANKEDFTDLHEWSRRRSLTGRSPYSDIKIQIDGGPITISTTASDREVSVDISTPSSPPQRVFDLDQRLNRVSKAEYEKIFTKR